MMTDRLLPDSRDTYRAFTTIQTRWMDNDVYGHVNNVTYLSYFDTAVNHYLVQEGLLDPLTSPIIGLVVETRCSYFQSIAFPDLVHAGIRVDRIGTSSVTYHVGIFRNEEPETAARGHFTHVYVDQGNRRPTPLPEAHQTALRKLMF